MKRVIALFTVLMMALVVAEADAQILRRGRQRRQADSGGLVRVQSNNNRINRNVVRNGGTLNLDSGCAYGLCNQQVVVPGSQTIIEQEPLVIQQEPLVIEQAPLVIQQEPLVVQRGHAVFQDRQFVRQRSAHDFDFDLRLDIRPQRSRQRFNLDIRERSRRSTRQRSSCNVW